ncbi:hypothetical protein GGR57DRAFT_261672 [Xylariaceae sp. FL1272]|nr:hypothetical protein GGR57DRAFT_261672 [Xylariaceae sp. FL1272]
MYLNRKDMESQAIELIRLLWLSPAKYTLVNGDAGSELTHEAYCEYYRHQWHLLASGRRDVAVLDTRDLHPLIRRLQANETRQNIVDDLMKSQAGRSEDTCKNAVNLAARLLLMLKFDVVKFQAVPRGVLDWQDDSLRGFVGAYFSRAGPVLGHDRVRLPKMFNAWSLEMVAGIKVDFTDNLADHLLLADDSRVLIFHHASFLECHRQRPRDSLFPPGLVDETLRTLALLFPQPEFASNSRRGRASKGSKWLHKVRADHRVYHEKSLDGRLALCGLLYAEDRRIERFHFWRDRLVILRQAYDDATPNTLSQWWHDRRNGVQWYTFWVAIMVLIITTFLGIVQCVASGLQVYKAYVP